jgi:hypothetical protein
MGFKKAAEHIKTWAGTLIISGFHGDACTSPLSSRPNMAWVRVLQIKALTETTNQHVVSMEWISSKFPDVVSSRQVAHHQRV